MRLHKSHLAFMSFAGMILISPFVGTESAIQFNRSTYPGSRQTAVSQLDDSIPGRSFTKTAINSTPSNTPTAPQPLPEWARKKEKKLDDPSWIIRGSQKLSLLLSPDTLSNADRFQYFVRETSELSNANIIQLGIDIDYSFKMNRIPGNLLPYARVLRTILDAQIRLLPLKKYIREVQNDPNRFDVPSEISSPPALAASGLFSSDIFSDPDPPTRLLNTLLRIPKNDIPKITNQLQNFDISQEWTRNVPDVVRRYMWYARDLISILQSNSILDSLKSDMT